jgi:endoglucanase
MEIHVSGNHLVDAKGATLQLRGVNRPGAERGPVDVVPIWMEGPTDTPAIAAMVAWKINCVRIPLNQQGWNRNIDNYQANLKAYVDALHAAGLYVILDLHWSAPGTYAASYQQGMADQDHSPTFWQSLATAFKSDLAVIFDLYNEPHIGGMDSTAHDVWAAWRDGTPLMTKYYPDQTSGGITYNWTSAGMQELVNTVRTAGATQPLLLSGLGWAGDLSGWLAHKPSDPLNALCAGVHVYSNTQHATQAQVAAVAAQVPVVIGELGEYDCSAAYITPWMTWADSLGVSYLAWSWYGDNAPCHLVSQVVTDWTATPTALGAGFKAHLGA